MGKPADAKLASLMQFRCGPQGPRTETRKTDMSPLLKFTAAAALALCIAPLSCAKTPAEEISVPVRYGDLNLASREGAHILLRRLDHAAHIACGDTPAPAELLYSRRYDECTRNAVARAVAQLNSPLVAKQLADRGGEPMLAD